MFATTESRCGEMRIHKKCGWTRQHQWHKGNPSSELGETDSKTGIAIDRDSQIRLHTTHLGSFLKNTGFWATARESGQI